MAQRKAPSAIGLSMLDLISNALAAVIILFIILSSLRMPSIPPERIKGTLFVRYEMKSTNSSEGDSSAIWLQPPTNPEMPPDLNLAEKRFWGKDIFTLNSKSWAFGMFPDCGSITKKTQSVKRSMTPCVMVYSPADSLNIHYLVIRDPVKGLNSEGWKTGVIYIRHNNITMKPQPAVAKIKAWFVAEASGDTIEVQKNMIAPTDTFGIEIIIPDWKNHVN